MGFLLHEGSCMAKAFPLHHMSSAVDLRYLGTHYGYDIYINPDTSIPGLMYAVWGNGEADYSCGVGYYISRTQRTFKDIGNPTMGLAVAVALLHHPEYTEMVLASHK